MTEDEQKAEGVIAAAMNKAYHHEGNFAGFENMRTSYARDAAINLVAALQPERVGIPGGSYAEGQRAFAPAPLSRMKWWRSMPIRPENRARYPKDWPAISLRIRARAGNQCEFCGVKNYQLGAWVAGRWHVAHPNGSGRHDWPRAGEYGHCVHGEHWVYTRVVRIVLTVAHLDHTPENCADENLKALCQRCHNTYDLPMRRSGIIARANANNGDLFERAALEAAGRGK